MAISGLGAAAAKKNPPAVSGAEYLAIAVAGMSIPREQFNEKLETLLPLTLRLVDEDVMDLASALERIAEVALGLVVATTCGTIVGPEL